MNAFDFIQVPYRSKKPRQFGLTSVIDKGLNIPNIISNLEITSEFLDIVKLGFGTAKLYSSDYLIKKVDLLKKNHLLVCPGGTFLEIAFMQNCIAEFVDRCIELGFNCIEVSDGVAAIDHDQKISIIKKIVKRRVCVISEVGRKNPVKDKSLSTKQRIIQITKELDAGVWKVILEGRESGNVGIFSDDTSIKPKEVEAITKVIKLSDLIFEAPLKFQQAWLINSLGIDVNLANVAWEDLVALESLRQGLRADTIKI